MRRQELFSDRSGAQLGPEDQGSCFMGGTRPSTSESFGYSWHVCFGSGAQEIHFSEHERAELVRAIEREIAGWNHRHIPRGEVK